MCFLYHLVPISWQSYCYLHQTVSSVISDFVVSVCRGNVSLELIRLQAPRVSPVVNQHFCSHNHLLCSWFWCFSQSLSHSILTRRENMLMTASVPVYAATNLFLLPDT